MRVKKTIRGFDYIEFRDQRDKECILLKSSLATSDAIWFGIDSNGHRMHLTCKQMKKLLPHLQKFAETGNIK